MGCEVCCVSEMCDMRSPPGTVGIIYCGSFIWSLFAPFGVGCVGDCKSCLPVSRAFMVGG